MEDKAKEATEARDAMNEDLELVVFRVNRTPEGLYTATSPQLEGVYLANRDLGKIVADVPNVIRLWYHRQRNQTVEVYGAMLRELDGSSAIPAVVVPEALERQALRA